MCLTLHAKSAARHLWPSMSFHVKVILERMIARFKNRIRLDTPMPPYPSVKAALFDEKKRTGIGPDTLLRGAQNVPPGLTPRKIRHWLSKKGKTAPVDC